MKKYLIRQNEVKFVSPEKYCETCSTKLKAETLVNLMRSGREGIHWYDYYILEVETNWLPPDPNTLDDDDLGEPIKTAVTKRYSVYDIDGSVLKLVEFSEKIMSEIPEEFRSDATMNFNSDFELIEVIYYKEESKEEQRARLCREYLRAAEDQIKRREQYEKMKLEFEGS